MCLYIFTHIYIYLYLCSVRPKPLNDVYIYIYMSSNFLHIYIYLYLINWEIPNVTRKGGSKYRAHQGNGTIWKMFLFCVFVFVGKRNIKNIYIY